MKTSYKITALIVLISLLFNLESRADSIFLNFTVIQCDSLILANAKNPDFVILDVRTAGEYNPEHLEGAIMRDYYNVNFSVLLDSLPKNKMYLVHCASGGRSASTMAMMPGKGFKHVFNMLGGMNSWKSNSLPTTSGFAPLLMAVSDSIIINDTINTGAVDTIKLTITNRANDILAFTSITSLYGTEFSTNFDTANTLPGAKDYTFSIFYQPIDAIADTLDFLIQSNAGSVEFEIFRTGNLISSINGSLSNDIKIFPNPANDKINIKYGHEMEIIEYKLFDITGRVLQGEQINSQRIIDVSHLKTGSYILLVQLPDGAYKKHILIQR